MDRRQPDTALGVSQKRMRKKVKKSPHSSKTQCEGWMPESQTEIGVNLENSRLGTGGGDAVKCVNESGTKKQSGQVDKKFLMHTTLMIR